MVDTAIQPCQKHTNEKGNCQQILETNELLLSESIQPLSLTYRDQNT